MRKNFRKAAISTICMLVVAIMSLTGATYAWFSAGNAAEVMGMKVEVTTSDGGIEVSKDGINFGTQLTLETKKTGVAPTSTVDAKKFVTAEFSPSSNQEIKSTLHGNVFGEDGALNTELSNVIVQKLWLQYTGTGDASVSLSGSYVSDIPNTTNNTNKTTQIAKAARIAVFKADGTLIGIMAPHKADGTITEDTASYLGVNGASDTFFAYGTDGTYTDSVALKASSSITIGLDGYGNNATQIVVVAWLEGQDAECTNPNAGGAFDIYLNFQK